MNSIDWSNPDSKITEHFTVREATWLPKIQQFHSPSDEEKQNLIQLFQKMEEIREFLGVPINVHVTIRPTAVNCDNKFFRGFNYNASVGGAPKSAHVKGLACDWNPYSMSCDEARMHLEPMLENLGIRMEKNPGKVWVHIDLYPPSPNRYFVP